MRTSPVIPQCLLFCNAFLFFIQRAAFSSTPTFHFERQPSLYPAQSLPRLLCRTPYTGALVASMSFSSSGTGNNIKQALIVHLIRMFILDSAIQPCLMSSLTRAFENVFTSMFVQYLAWTHSEVPRPSVDGCPRKPNDVTSRQWPGELQVLWALSMPYAKHKTPPKPRQAKVPQSR